jgi:hypothetical protein
VEYGLSETARLQAAGVGTIDAPLSGAESGTGHHVAKATERAGGEAHAVRLSAAEGAADAGRSSGQPQAGIPPVSRGRIGNEDSATTADPLERRGGQPGGDQAESTLVDGFRD